MAPWFLLLSLGCTWTGIVSADGVVHMAFRPVEDAEAILHNPGMGWVVYENFPVDDALKGSSTLLTMPGDSFPEADAVALMFSWADIEVEEGRYDFSRVDIAYEYWRSRGKEIQLRMSTEPLMLHVPGRPFAGTGVPKHLLDQLPPEQKQTRHMDGESYTVVDSRNKLYERRLKGFLEAVRRHFNLERPVTLIDLRGFGAWGEWHSGFRYDSVGVRRDALKGILDMWTSSFPDQRLALSYSYDPDGPKEFYAGPAEKLEPSYTRSYDSFLRYSAFDYALKKSNITFRRDGCGGAVHSNERQLNEEAFVKYRRAPMFGEFLGAYSAVRKGGSNWVTFMVEDALSLHPNYLNLIGWQSGDARLFSKERPDLIALGLARMGFRFVPVNARCDAERQVLTVEISWVNRGVGRALRDFDVRLELADAKGSTVAVSRAQTVRSSEWLAGQTYHSRHKLNLTRAGGEFQLLVRMTDKTSGRAIQLPLRERVGEAYVLGAITR
jgi:hypothetical protein